MRIKSSLNSGNNKKKKMMMNEKKNSNLIRCRDQKVKWVVQKIGESRNNNNNIAWQQIRSRRKSFRGREIVRCKKEKDLKKKLCGWGKGRSRRNSARCQVKTKKIGGVVPTTFPDSIQLEAFLGLQDPLNSSNQFPTRHHSKSLNPFFGNF